MEDVDSAIQARTNGGPKANGNGNGNRQTAEHRDSERARAWQRLRDCLLLFRADGDERKAVRLRRCESDLRIVRRTTRLLLAGICNCTPDRAHLATTRQLHALCDRLDQADGIDFDAGSILASQAGRNRSGIRSDTSDTDKNPQEGATGGFVSVSNVRTPRSGNSVEERGAA